MVGLTERTNIQRTVPIPFPNYVPVHSACNKILPDSGVTFGLSLLRTCGYFRDPVFRNLDWTLGVIPNLSVLFPFILIKCIEHKICYYSHFKCAAQQD